MTFLRHFPDLLELLRALRIGQPHGLEGAVRGQGTGIVIVDSLSRTGQHAGCRIVIVHDEISIRLVALQRDPYHHLPESRARQRVGTSQGLGAEDHVDAERPALPHDPVEQQRRLLGGSVVLGEQLLKLVDQQQGPRQGLPGKSAIPGHILRPAFAEKFTSLAEFIIHPAQHAQAEFAVALDGHHPGMRQLVLPIHLELDALLEVDQIKLHFLR